MKAWHWFVIMTVVCWGAYIPTIHLAQKAIGGKAASLWGFMLVGAAYVLVAVLIPGGLLAAKGEFATIPASGGLVKAFLGGALGAIGALGIILAIMNGGDKFLVPSLVFAGAPIMATVVTMMISPPGAMPDWRYFTGIVIAAGGVAMAMYFKPG